MVDTGLLVLASIMVDVSVEYSGAKMFSNGASSEGANGLTSIELFPAGACYTIED